MVSIYNLSITLLFALGMACSQIILSLASKEIFSYDAISLKILFGSKLLWLAISIYAASLFFWIYILSIFDVKYAYPISAISIFFVPVLNGIFLRSLPSVSYWIGLIFILIGIVILSVDRS